jgi:hypothetical protein
LTLNGQQFRWLFTIDAILAVLIGEMETIHLWRLWDVSGFIQKIAVSGRWDTMIGVLFAPALPLVPLAAGLTIWLFIWKFLNPRKEDRV